MTEKEKLVSFPGVEKQQQGIDLFPNATSVQYFEHKKSQQLAEEDLLIRHPSYYLAGGYELKEVLKAYFPTNPRRWQEIQYIVRAGKKDPRMQLQDLKKAIFWLEDEIKDLEAGL